MGSFDGALLSRGLSVSGLRTGIEETDEALVRIRPLEDRSELDNSLLVGDSRATEKRSRARESARFAIVLSKAATAMASKPTGFCIRDELSKEVNWERRGWGKRLDRARVGRARRSKELRERWTNHKHIGCLPGKFASSSGMDVCLHGSDSAVASSSTRDRTSTSRCTSSSSGSSGVGGRDGVKTDTRTGNCGGRNGRNCCGI
ncbi:hypothetical protein F5X97DRAFT_12616 [Nemania serpens]|nr:hypothetical protein F5X97DRAFT_12616 [Nemania serpens]